MSISDVVSLDDYRGRRDRRFRQTLALHAVDPARSRLVPLLRDAVEAARADRGAILWIDEYGGGLVHTHCLLDLASDRPRRTFAVEPLRRAWEEGIPGLLDEPDLGHGREWILAEEGPRSFCSVALGSDGVRAWFLAVDSRASRNRLEQDAVESLMFVAGECASILLHPQQSRERAGSGSSDDERSVPVEQLRAERFSGWPVLQDTGGSQHDRDRGKVITIRFLVSRLLDGLVEDDFAVDQQSLLYQVEGIRREVRQVPAADRSRWERVLQAAVSGDHAELARAALALGNDAENRGHLHGARELDRLAYDIAVVAGDPEAAVDAARFLGRVCRRTGGWEDSEEWYEVGRAVARSAGLRRQEALVLSGLGNTSRVRGNLPSARETYSEVLEIAGELSDDRVRGSALQNLMLVEKHAGRTDDALRYGWAAVEAFTEELHVLAALADLGDIFIRCGELDSAETAFEIVAVRVENVDIRVVALDALAHISARRGDPDEFLRRVERIDPAELERASVEVQAEVQLFRGKSYVAIGERDEARQWFRRSLGFAEEHGLNRIIFEAEEALEELREGAGERLVERELPEPRKETMSGLREPLTTLRAVPQGTSIPGAV